MWKTSNNFIWQYRLVPLTDESWIKATSASVVRRTDKTFGNYLGKFVHVDCTENKSIRAKIRKKSDIA